jgi:hypothetical protein
MDERYSYYKGDNCLKIRKTYTKEEGFSIELMYFDSEGKIQKSELYYEKDTTNAIVVTDEFAYSSFGKILSYKRTHNQIKHADCLEFKYDGEKIVESLLYNNCHELTKRTTISYNKRGLPVSEVIDHLDPETLITGGRSEGGFQRFFYSFDKQGNWTKRFYVTSKGQKILDTKRKLFYKS